MSEESCDSQPCPAEPRLSSMESAIAEIRDGMKRLETMYADMFRQNAETVAHITNSFSDALKVQANALSMPILKDVLMPVMMKIFLFFSGVILVLLTAVLGIKWAFGDVVKLISGS